MPHLIITACLCICCLASQLVASEAITVSDRYETSWRGHFESVPVMVLRGDAKQRAQAHGYLAAEDIIDLLNGYVLDQVSSRVLYERILTPMAEITRLGSGMETRAATYDARHRGQTA